MSGHPILRALAFAASTALLVTALAVPATAGQGLPAVVETVKRFAPVLAFDSSQQGYPMSAEVFFERMLREERNAAESEVTWVGRQADRSLEPPLGYTYSRVPSSRDSSSDNWYWTVQTAPGEKNLLNRGTRPTYYSVAPHPNGALRIMYWWFYGYQYPCNPTLVGGSGAHFGDWERVMVTTTTDRRQVESVTYWQHGGWYTRTPGPLVAGRPLVFVGKDSHGSYHYSREVAAFNHSCFYWDDIRSPNGAVPYSPPARGAKTDYWWTSTSPLVKLPKVKDQSTEDWMFADRVGQRWGNTALLVQSWKWGPTVSFYCASAGGFFKCDGPWYWTSASAVGTHPTKETAPNWTMAACNGNGGNTSSKDGCSKNQAPLWAVGMGTLKANKFVWAKRIGVKFVIDRVDRLQTSAARNAKLYGTLPKGFSWVVDSKVACLISDRTKLWCNLGLMPIEDDAITVRVHAKKRPGAYRAVLRAAVIWPDLQQSVKTRFVFQKR